MIEIIKSALGASIPLLLFYLGYLIKRRQDAREGKHRNRIQFELEQAVFGPQKGFYMVEISMLLHNQGLVRSKLNGLFLTVKGINQDTEIGLFKDLDTPVSMAHFPIPIVSTNVLEKKYTKEENEQIKKEVTKKNEWFIEPGIAQRFSYVARIPEAVRFILVRSSFKYHKNSVHSVQKVFELIDFKR